ncbi:carboxylesterase/lipase family protein [Noviherbaspirillum galbum]|uniref:Carboxylic ester hydrolase n=1 Tax=Noviherbaspirillum galbum TaxID=2709383 RepID=A0A6B3STU9_9BURK|nr:carboxylesterase family protein [Noviherbaspirillum galbum]NEX61792.1 carboxylesterase family protein [Noviherbaspirillum galbum]
MNIRRLNGVALAWAASASLGLAMAGCGGNDSSDGVPLIRSTEFGQVEGVMNPSDKSVAWLGVPFAKPPVGNLRWQPPQPPDAWSGVKPAKEYASACTQIGGMFGPPPKGKDYGAISETFYKPVGSEDCLYLNIWRPQTDDGTKLPVIVFIHGGSNVVGASFDPIYLGGNLANNANAIVVTVGYRLGVLGWFAHPALNTGDPVRDSGNYALLDMIQSLKFVKNNIASFGGDPNNVTIMGQSAGAVNVHGLIVSPMAAGLFHKAIPLSGGLGGSPTATAVNKANAFINALLIKDGLAKDKASADAYRAAQDNTWLKNYLMSKSSADLYNIQVDPTGGKWGTGSRTFEPGSTTATLWATVAPIADGTVVPSNVTTAISSGKFNKVPQLAGNTAEEGKLFSSAFKVDDYTRIKWMNGTYLGTVANLKLEDIVDRAIVNPLTVDNYNAYTYNNPNRIDPAPSLTTATFLGLGTATSTVYYPQVPVYAYDFKWNKQPAPWNDVYGAWHTGDLPFVFGNFGLNLDSFGWTKANEPGRLALSNVMQKSIAAFIRTGNPNNAALGANWDQWTPTAPRRMGFDASLTQATVAAE